MKKSEFVPYGIAIFAIILFADQFTKHVIRETFPLGQNNLIFPGLWFTFAKNTGAAWGLFSNTNSIFIWLSLIVFVILIYAKKEFRTTVEQVCYALIMAGLWGNLLDRLFFGYVIDFIDLGWFPIFNIADSAISVAIFVYLLEQWRKTRTLPSH